MKMLKNVHNKRNKGNVQEGGGECIFQASSFSYCFRNYRKHLGRKRAIYNRKSNKDDKNWNKEYDSQLNDRGHERDVKAKITSYKYV